MPIDLQPVTPAGATLVGIAERIARERTDLAARHDRDGSYPHRGVAALRSAGYLSAPVPESLGGLGAESVHDVVVAASRLARGDAALAIGASMHLCAVLNMVRRWRVADAAGNETRAEAFAASLAAVTDMVLAAAISEPGQDLSRPATTAVRTADGWRIDGSKVFCTMAPAATHFYTAVRFTARDGERYGYALIPAGAPGVRVHDDWDALGMRASGSHSVSFAAVQLPAAALRGGFPAGDVHGYVARNLPSGLLHAAASLGIAEAAWTEAAGAVRRAPAGRTQALAAEGAVELSAARATLSRAARLVDEHHAAHPADDGTPAALLALFAEGQAAKAFVCDAAARIVDRALACSGGGGNRAASPLSRAYRDVRAGAFMHPLGANRGFDFVGRVALGLDPELR